MGKEILEGFDVKTFIPLDQRFSTQSLNDIKTPYEGLKTFNTIDKKNYQFINNEWVADIRNPLTSFYNDLINGKISKIKMIGDSLTEGYGVTEHIAITPNTNNGNPIIFNDGTTTYYESDYTSRCFANYFRQYLSQNFPTVKFTNAGIGGKTMKFADENKTSWLSNNEDVLFVMLGTNDKYPETLTEYIAYASSFLTYAKSKCNKLIICTPPYCANDYVNGVKASSNQFTTDDMNIALRNIANTINCDYISILDIMKTFSTVNQFDLNQMINVDLVHLNLIGHYVVWYAIYKSLGIDTSIGSSVYENNFKQIVIDGDFQVAQINPTLNYENVNPPFYSYPICDMWKIVGNNTLALPTIKHSIKKTYDIPNGKNYYRIDTNGAIQDGQYLFAQYIPNGITNNLIGKEILYVSFYARSSLARKLNVSFLLDFGTGGSPSSTIYTPAFSTDLTTNFVRYTFALTFDIKNKTFGTNNDDKLSIRFGIRDSTSQQTSNGTVDIAKVLCSSSGSTPLSYGKSFEDELYSCMRYLEKSLPYSIAMNTASPIYMEENQKVLFKQEKATQTPTIKIYSYLDGTLNNVTYYNGSAFVNSTNYTLVSESAKHFYMSASLNSLRYNWYVDCRP